MEKSESLDPRYAPPQAHVADVNVVLEGDALAGRGRRFWAAMLDLGIALAAMWIVSILTPWNPWRAATQNLAAIAVNTAAGFAMFAMIHGWLLARRGQTVGKAVMGLRIVRADGSRASLTRLLGLRYAVGTVISSIPYAGMVFAVADGLMIFRQSRRCIHDLIADTIVVQA